MLLREHARRRRVETGLRARARGRNKFRRNTVKPKEGWLFATAKQKETSRKEDGGEGGGRRRSLRFFVRSSAIPCIFALTPMRNLWSNNGYRRYARSAVIGGEKKREAVRGE